MTGAPGRFAGAPGGPAGAARDPAAPCRVAVREESDVAIARVRARALAHALGLEHAAVEAAATAVTEIARNMLVHAHGGEIALGVAWDRARRGLRVIARDDGPGIPDLTQAMRDGFSTAGGLGLGLSSARRLMDGFQLSAPPGGGTTVTMIKWAPGGSAGSGGPCRP